MIKISFDNPLTEGTIDDVDANFKANLRLIDGKKIIEYHVIGMVEVNEDNQPVYDSEYTGKHIDI